MPRKSRLKSAINSLAHHSVSRLCYLHPVLGHLAIKRGHESLTIDLLNSELEGWEPHASAGLAHGIETLTDTFSTILKSEGFSVTDLEVARITFLFSDEGWPDGVQCKVMMLDGWTHTIMLDQFGQPAHIVYISNND